MMNTISKDLFGNEISDNPISVNIYADEVVDKKCPYTGHFWHYIGIIVEDLATNILTDIIRERFMGNFYEQSQYFAMNNKIVYWCQIRTADTKNICRRWFEYSLFLKSYELSRHSALVRI